MLPKHILAAGFMVTTAVHAVQAPFHKGVNLTGWLQTSNARQIQFTQYTKQDFINIKSLGCDVVRLPINLHAMTSGAPDYTVDPLFYSFLDPIVGWAEELEIHLLLDNHTFDPMVNTSDNVGDILVPVWTQMARHFKGHSNFINYEVLNEPHGIADKTWNDIQQRVIAAIRAVDQKHTVVVGPASWNSYNNLAQMPQYSDGNLIYTFHFYDPFLFTHQGASWTDPSMSPLSGVPFPYDASRMPDCPAALKGTWIETSLSSGYQTDGTVKHVKELIDIAIRFGAQRNVPLFCGEFGVYIPNSSDADRVGWYRVVREYLEEKGISWTTWDYQGGFGLFEAGTSERFEYDLNVPLVEALGLTAPPQQEYQLKPDTVGFLLYDDFSGMNVSQGGYTTSGSLDFYSGNDPFRGQYCIEWSGVPQYSNIGFAFKPVKDLSLLVDKGSALDFWVRGDSPGARFDVRFIDTKTNDPDDHPWRMRKTVDEALTDWDGAWHHVKIPLDEFTEHGSWDNDAWYNPQGLFDWSAVHHFEIVSEHHALTGMVFGFDEIRVLAPGESGIEKSVSEQPLMSSLNQNYPNPFNPSTTLRYGLPRNGEISIAVFNTAGRLVRTLTDGKQSKGEYAVFWDGRDNAGFRVSSGVYFCRMKVSGFTQTRKMILLD